MDKEKGTTIAVFGLALIFFYVIILAIFVLVAQNNSIIAEILANAHLILFRQNFTVFTVFPLLLILYTYKLINGFFDGILLAGVNILVTLFIYANVLNLGKGVIYITILVLDIHIIIDFTFALTLLLYGYLWIFCCEILIILVTKDIIHSWAESLKVFINHIQTFWRSNRKNNAFNSASNQPKLLEKSSSVMVEQGLLKPEIQNTSCENDSPTQAHPMTHNTHRFRPLFLSQRNWITLGSQNIRCDAGELPLSKDWFTTKTEFRKSFRNFYLVDTFIIIISAVIYGLLTYYFVERGNTYYNQTSLAFFFPLWTILFTSFKSLGHFIRALIFLIVTITIQFELRAFGIITAEGIFMISIIIRVSKYFFFNLSPQFNALTDQQLLVFLVIIFVVILLIQLILMLGLVIYRNFGGFVKTDMFITTRHIYLRRKRSFNNYYILFTLFLIYIWPFNLENYRDLFQQIRYKQVSLRESWDQDYGRINYSIGLKKVEKTPRNPRRALIFAFFFILIGITSLSSINSMIFPEIAPNLFGIISIAVAILCIAGGIRQLWLFRYRLYRVKIHYSWQKTEGSLFMLSSEDIIIIHEIPQELAEIIPAVNSYG